MIAQQAVGVAVRPIRIHGRDQSGVDVRPTFMETLMAAHETLELVAINFDRSGVRLQGGE